MSGQLLASKIVVQEEEPQIRAIAAAPTAVTGAVGIAERGPVGVAVLCTSFEEYVRTFGGYTANADLALAAQGFFENGGAQFWAVRTVHYSDILDANTKTSVAGAVNIPTDTLVSSPGYVQATIPGPWTLTPGDILAVAISDGGGVMQAALNCTFNAGAAARENSNGGPYVLADGQTLTVKINQGAVQTITFDAAEFVDITAATLPEVLAVINAQLAGGNCTLTTGDTRLTITSDKRGNGSYVEVTGGTANAALGFNTAEVQGTGNVSDILAVTYAEFATIVDGVTADVVISNEGGAPRLTRIAVGATSKIQVAPSSTCEQVFGFDTAIHSGNAAGAVNTWTIQGKTDGEYANALRVRIDSATNGNAAEANLFILKNGVIQESFPNLSTDPDAANYFVTVINATRGGSRLVQAVDLAPAVSAPRPANGTYVITGGNDGLSGITDTDFIGSSVSKTGLRALDQVDNLRILLVPGRSTAAVHNAMVTYAEITRRGTVFAVLSCPANLTAEDAITYVKSTALLQQLSEFAAIYWPRIKAVNPSTTVFGSATTITVDPVGHIAGLYARNDGKPGGVYEAPAGIEWGRLVGAVALETDEVKQEEKRDLIYPELINPIVVYPGTQVHIDGSRTLKSTGPFPTIGERRGVIFIETSIQAGLAFGKHRRIRPALRAQFERTVRLFLGTQLALGAFASDNPRKAFFVDFGPGLNPPSEGYLRKVNGRIGLATAKPAEFIVLQFSQDQRELEAELAQQAA